MPRNIMKQLHIYYEAHLSELCVFQLMVIADMACHCNTHADILIIKSTADEGL